MLLLISAIGFCMLFIVTMIQKDEINELRTQIEDILDMLEEQEWTENTHYNGQNKETD
jgi:hypothetical protein